MMHPQRQSYAGAWAAGNLFSCREDPEACLGTVVMPCITYSENYRMLHGETDISTGDIDPCLVYTFLMCISGCTLQSFLAYGVRKDIRRKYNLQPEPCSDFWTHLCCHFCALCQEHRELKSHPLTVWPMPAVPEQVAAPQMSIPQQVPVPFHHPQEAPMFMAPPMMRPRPYYTGHRGPQPMYHVQQFNVRPPMLQHGGFHPGNTQQPHRTASP